MSPQDLLDRRGWLACSTSGTSMSPLLRDRRDTVILSPCTRPLRRYDVPLYRRGEAYVLHRIVTLKPDCLVTRGDGCLGVERVPRDQVIGVMTQLYRGDRPVNLRGVGYWLYVRLWCGIPPLHALLTRLWNRMARRRNRA